MTANGVAAWVDPEGDGIAVATLNSASGSVADDSVTTAKIADGSIINADVNAAAAIAVSKLAAGTATYVLTSTAGTAVWSAPASGAPSGSAGGSLTGTYPNPTIATIPSGATATTQTAADNSTKVATTAYTDTGLALKANLASPTFTGTPVLPTGTTGTTQSAADGSTKLATTAYVDTADALKANLASPTFTGTVVLPTGAVTSGMILDGTILNADVNAAAAVDVSKLAPGTASQVLTTTSGTAVWADAAGGAPSGAAGGSLTGTYPNPTIASIPSGATATTQTAADNSTKVATTAYVDTADALKANLASPTFTGTPVVPAGTTGTTQTASDSSTKLATTAYVKAQLALSPDQIAANTSVYSRSNAVYGGQFVGITALKPVFIPINVGAIPAMTISNIRLRVSTLLNASTIGVAIYSVTYPSSAHLSATLVAQLNASQSGTSAGVFQPALTTGAVGSGAAALSADFTTTRYLIGAMASDVATLKCASFVIGASDVGLGVISWTGTARSSVTDWPSSFTEAANIAAVSVATPTPGMDLLTATGAFYI